MRQRLFLLTADILAARMLEEGMRRIINSTLFVLMAVPIYSCLAQIPSRLRNAPFTGRMTKTIRRGGEVSTTTGIVARRSEGSVYVGLGARREGWF